MTRQILSGINIKKEVIFVDVLTKPGLDHLIEKVKGGLDEKVDKQEEKWLISTTDLQKLHEIEDGAEKNDVTGVKGDAEKEYRKGKINITAADIGLGEIDNTPDADKNVNSAVRDGSGNIISQTYISDVSVDGTSVTVTKNGTATKLTVSPEVLTINGADGLIGTYDGSTAKIIEITPQSIGAATKTDIDNQNKQTLDSAKEYTDSKTAPSATILSPHTIALSGGVTGTATSFDGSKDITIPVTAVDASKLTGTIDIARLPAASLERLIVVDNKAARLALKNTNAQIGDTVQEADTGLMYRVVDDTKLNSEDGYKVYTAGSATYATNAGTATYANNAEKVNGHTVESNVPADAKFTDTVYDDSAVKKSISDETDRAKKAEEANSDAIATKMTTKTYDADGDGMVDNAAKVNGHSVESDVPADAVFTDTVYDDTALSAKVQKNTDALGGHSLGMDVPAGSKLTDTVYDDTTIRQQIDAAIKTESGSSPCSYSAGDFFVFGGKLYRASIDFSSITLTDDNISRYAEAQTQTALNLLNKDIFALNNTLVKDFRLRNKIRRQLSATQMQALHSGMNNKDIHSLNIIDGDYYISGRGYEYTLGEYYYLKGAQTQYSVISAPHYAVVVDAKTNSKWAEDPDQVKSGALHGSTLLATLKGDILTNVIADMEAIGFTVATRKCLESNALDATRTNRWGQATGASSSWNWYDQQIIPLSETQVYGSIIAASSFFDEGEANRQLACFRNFAFSEISDMKSFWLREPSSASCACRADGDTGSARGNFGVSGASAAFGLIIIE